jgi:hypothetical protein
MVVLKMRRPTLFDFEAWPVRFCPSVSSIRLGIFSIASGPDSPFIEFYIEVFDEQSWTGKLWQLINDNRAEEGRTESALRIDIDLMGPYGTGLVRKEDFSHASPLELVQVRCDEEQVCVPPPWRYQLTRPFLHCIAGIVPMLSL